MGSAFAIACPSTLDCGLGIMTMLTKALKVGLIEERLRVSMMLRHQCSS
jgi:hypothetical protein